MAMKIVNARIWTGDPARPLAEALAVAGDTLARVGSARDVADLRAARTIDARGRLVVPGFIDSHVHFLDGGQRLLSIALRPARSRAAFVEAVRGFAGRLPAGTWITGGDWDHENWGGELPTREWIDAVTPRHPVWVSRLDGHMALANTAALRAAGVTSQTRDVDGGTIVRDAQGEPTGLLKDNAMRLVSRHVPPPSADALDRALAAAMRHVGERGVTSVHHMGTWDDLAVFERARAAHTLTTRIYAAVPLATWDRLAATVKARRFGGDDGRGDDWLRIGLLKGFVDGSLGSHTAAFFDPFTDSPGDRGLFVNTSADLQRWIAGADTTGLHVAVHAIGDRANHELLNIFEATARANGARDRRFRIEHAQHLAARDIPRFATLGVIASMQPYHAADDGRWADRVIGASRAKTTYAFRALLDARTRIAFGSDWFVAPPTAIEGIHAAVTRRTLDGRHPDGWVPEQKISVEEALRAYTVEAAAAEFGERRKGRLAAGLLADFVMLDRNLLEIPAAELEQTRVDFTVVGGRIVFER
jgi:predicted amidohydrolase YtcJ